MCGILGVISKGNEGLDLKACRRSLSLLTQRGPDLSFDEVWNGRAFLGQTILSISGSAKKSASHLTSVSKRFSIWANGEIYNFRELQSKYLADLMDLYPQDTDMSMLVNLHEKLLAPQVPEILDGMYAYMLLDKKEKKLHICCDVQGEKSLYIYEGPKMIIISSEMSPILKLVPALKPDPQVLRDYFYTRHFMFLERTLYPGVRQLAPGQMETIDLNSMKRTLAPRLSPRAWINPERMSKNEGRSLDDLADELDSLLGETIREMVPGRKFASVVSGGVDSSLVSYYLKKVSKPDLLVAVNHIGKDMISHDLEDFEKALHQKIHRIDVDLFFYSQEIARCQKVCRSPLPAHSFVGQSIQSAYVRRHQCRVLFGGDGADELFGGYACYHEIRQPRDSRFSPSLYSTYSPSRVEFEADDSQSLQNELSEAWKNALEMYHHIKDPEAQMVQAMMYMDFTWQLPAVGLRGSDLMSLMWSVETRSPFVRRPIVEFALNLPAWAKKGKPILKKLFLRYFPANLLVEKQGFAGFPNESAVFMGDIGDYLAIDFLGIKREILDSLKNDRDMLWKLTNVEYFLREAI